MTVPLSTQETSPPRWIKPWLVALTPIYVLSPLALLGLTGLKKLPPLVFWLLGIYAFTQQLPALLAPEPLLASALALARTALMLGLVGTGALLGSALKLNPVSLGLFVVSLTALVTNVLNQVNFSVERLNHPYMTSITLGLAGTLAVCLAMFAGGRWWWRISSALLGIIVLLFSGSRGPLLAAVVGVVLGVITQRRRRYLVIAALGFVMVTGGVLVGSRDAIQALDRFGQFGVSGREVVWRNTLSVVQNEPWSGVGSYRLGTYLTEPGKCLLFQVNSSRQVQASCPPWLEKLGQPWLIAHSAALQQLAETGPLGLMGLFLLLGVVVTATFLRSRPEPLAVAVVSGLLVSTVTDNTLLVPSPFSAEVFWLVAGTQLVALQPSQLNWKAGAVTAFVSALLTLPLLLMLPFRSTSASYAVNGRVFALETVKDLSRYRVDAQLQLPLGRYDAVVNSCQPACRTLKIMNFTVDSQTQPFMLSLTVDTLVQARDQRLELLIYDQRGVSLQPVVTRTWPVRWQP